MKDKIKNLAIIVAFSLIPTFLIWLPFFTRIDTFWHVRLPQTGLAAVVSNYDGPLYLIAAKTLYNKESIKTNFQFPLATEYYPAHFPLFPILIRTFSFITNYPYSMIFVTLISSVLAIYFFHLLISKYVTKKDALFLTFLFSIFPARWLIVRSVGSPDPLFVGAIIASLFYFKDKKYWLAGIWGAVAQLTKSPGILLFVSYFIFFTIPLLKSKYTMTRIKILETFNFKKIYPLLLIPLSLLAVFTFYWFTQGDFMAYFHSGDNIHLTFPPFQIFDYTAPWVGTFWIEEVIWLYIFGGLGFFYLIKQGYITLASFVGIFFLSILFVAHRDVSRYMLPIVPFLFIAFAKLLVSKEFKYVLILILIPIYLYAIAFITNNVTPIGDWSPLL